MLRYVRMSDNAYAPEKVDPLAAGFDLRSVEETVVPAEGVMLVRTGLKLELPKGTYGRLAPRSGLALNHFIDVGAGVIDRSYRGEVKIVLYNHAKRSFPVRKGDRIAQLICECCTLPKLEEILEEEMSETQRGCSGFGSSGLC